MSAPTPPGLDPAAFARARAALQQELAHTPPGPARTWRRDAAALALAVQGPFVLAAAAGLAVGFFPPAALRTHAPALVALALACAACATAAFAPRRRAWRRGALALAGVAAAVLLWGRAGVAAGSDTAPWLCTVSHLGAGLVPLVAAALLLRSVERRPGRLATAGVAVGTLGAMFGELGCGQGWEHALLFHLSAWALAAVALGLVASRLPPRSFAP